MQNSEVQFLNSILNAVLGKDNQLRKQCEVQLQELKTQEPNKLCLYLLKILQESPDAAVRLLCSVLLRRYFNALSDEKENLWAVMTPENKEIIKDQMLKCLDNERERNVLHGVCDVVSEIAGSILDIEQKDWAELKKKIFQDMVGAQNVDPRLVEAGLKILTTVFPYIADDILEQQGGDTGLIEMFARTLESKNLDVQVGAIQALGSFLEVVNSEDTKKFRALVPSMLQVAVGAAEKDEETELESVLITLIEITEAEPKFFKDHFGQIFHSMLPIFNKTDYTNEMIRHQPLELLVTIVERVPSIAEKNVEGLKMICQMIFKIMVDIDESVNDTWATPPEGYSEGEEEDDRSDSVNFGQTCIDRMVGALGEELMLPLLSELIQGALGNESDWRFKNAGLMALSQIGEYIDEVSKISNLVPIMLQHLSHSHPKVRYAALHCIGQVSEDMNPEFQENYHETILPPLFLSLSDPVQRVQAHACAAVTNFLEGVEPEVAQGVVATMLPKLFDLVNNGVSHLKENAMTAIASLGEACKDGFISYYDQTMPLLFQLLLNSNKKEYKQFRGQTIECITLIAGAVGLEKFRPHSADVINAMLAIQEKDLDQKDPQRNYLLSAWQRICLIMKDEFAPFLKQIFPSVLKQANLSPQMSISGQTEGKSDLTDILKEVQSGKGEEGEKKYIAHTAETEEKEVAINMLIVFIDELKGLFYEFIDPTTQVVLPLLGYSANDEIRKSAASTLPGLIRCAKAANNDPKLIVSMAGVYLQELYKALHTEIETEVMTIQISAIKEIFEEIEFQFMETEGFNGLCDELFGLLNKSNKRKEQYDKIRKSEEVEEEEREIAKCDIEDEEEFQMCLAELFGILFKTHKNHCMPLLNTIYNELLPNYMKPEASNMQHKFGIFILVDMVEFLGTDIIGSIFTQISQAIIKFASHETFVLRQASCYGIGMLARFGNEYFAAVAQEAVQALLYAINIPLPHNATPETKKKWGHSRDNAISSIGKIIKFQSNTLGDMENIKKAVLGWLGLLPLNYDKQEAKLQHELLVDIILENETLIYGEAYENLERVFIILASTLGTKYANTQTNVKAKEVFVKLRAKVGPALDNLWAGLDNAKQSRLKKILDA